MAINFWRWLTGKKDNAAAGSVGATGKSVDITCTDLHMAAAEYALRNVAFLACVDMVANAIGRCEFRTYVGNQETQGPEYYMLNVEPNVNQNSTAFWREVICRLYTYNEALIISTKTRDGRECLVCADGWTASGFYPQKMREYTNVQVGEVSYQKTFRENEVLHLTLNHENIKPVLDGLYESYRKMISEAQKYYTAQNGTHMKVHVGQIESRQPEWSNKFQEMLAKNVGPFLQGANGILPEFDGYEYSVLDFGRDGETANRIRDLMGDVWNTTARAFLIPSVLLQGSVEATGDANRRFLTYVIDPLCDQIQEELNRKRYRYDRWANGDFVRVDSSSIIHFDIFENAANIEKVVGSGIFSLNDVLRAANQTPIPADWADKHYMTLNITEMGNQTRQLESGGG